MYWDCEFYIAMSWDESDFLNEADRNIYVERITIDEKMRTKLTLEQKRWTFDIIGKLNRCFKTKTENNYRYDVYPGCVGYCNGKVGFES